MPSAWRRHKSSFKTVRTIQPGSHVARRIVRTIGKSKPELVFTPGGKFLVLVSALWPKLADKLMRIYHDDIAGPVKTF